MTAAKTVILFILALVAVTNAQAPACFYCVPRSGVDHVLQILQTRPPVNGTRSETRVPVVVTGRPTRVPVVVTVRPTRVPVVVTERPTRVPVVVTDRPTRVLPIRIAASDSLAAFFSWLSVLAFGHVACALIGPGERHCHSRTRGARDTSSACCRRACCTSGRYDSHARSLILQLHKNAGQRLKSSLSRKKWSLIDSTA
jgi:hypothetical protein